MPKYLDFKEAKCKNCYKCLKNCPVKAIKIENNQATIMDDKCILCGNCTLICPQNAKEVHSEINEVMALLKEGKVIASVAPSFISNFPVENFEVLEEGLKKLGFTFAEETARGAKVVTEEYERLLSTKTYKNFITSCCPAVNNLISLYYPDAIKYLAPVDTPMIAHAKILKKENPDAKIVFVGPCIAKKKEAKESGIIDGVLTFEELRTLFTNNKIDLATNCKAKPTSWNKARFYPISRGIIKSLENAPKEYEYIAIDGVDRCKQVLEEIETLENVFIEINACEAGCIKGPCSLNKHPIKANTEVRKYVQSNAKKNVRKLFNTNNGVDISCKHDKYKIDSITPTEEEIKKVLEKTGKFSKEDELNCGACGYSTCREKAWAVINGYADIEMCLPYMRERAENMSNEIMQNSPNGIVVVNDSLQIVEINSKAKTLLGLYNFKSKENIIIDLLDGNMDFAKALSEKRSISSSRIYISKTNTYVDLSITYMKEHNMMFGVMKDITERINYTEKLNKIKEETLETTDAVIKKQMRVVQEIASLLGETTAETKVALVKMRDALKEDVEKGED